MEEEAVDAVVLREVAPPRGLSTPPPRKGPSSLLLFLAMVLLCLPSPRVKRKEKFFRKEKTKKRTAAERGRMEMAHTRVRVSDGFCWRFLLPTPFPLLLCSF